MQDKETKGTIEAILKDILDEELSEYDDNELDIINDIVNEIPTGGVTPVWKGGRLKKNLLFRLELESLNPNVSQKVPLMH